MTENDRALFAGWSSFVKETARYSSSRQLFSMPVDEWKFAGRPTAVHVFTEFTVSVPFVKK